MGPDPTRAYFWPVVNKRTTRHWPGYFLTWPKVKEIENLTFLGEIFRIQTQAIDGWPNPTRPKLQKIDPTRVKYIWPGPITSSNPRSWATAWFHKRSVWNSGAYKTTFLGPNADLMIFSLENLFFPQNLESKKQYKLQRTKI